MTVQLFSPGLTSASAKYSFKLFHRSSWFCSLVCWLIVLCTVYPANSTPYQSWCNIDHHPIRINGISILVICVCWLGMCCGVPSTNPNQQIVPPQNFPLIQEFKNYQCCIRLGFCCVLVLLAGL